MNKTNALLVAGAIFFGLVTAQAQSLPSMRVRGTITEFDGQQLQVKTRESKDIRIGVTDNTKINVLYPRSLRDVSKGSFIGVTAIQHGPETPLVAREIHVFAEAQRGTGEGHYAWDLEPGASMTNANVDAIVEANDGEQLTLSYKGGSQKIIVPQGVPVVSFKPAGKSALKAGAQIFCITQQAADGTLTAQHISVGMNGIKPPM